MKNVIIIFAIVVVGAIALFSAGPIMNKNVKKSQVQVNNVVDVGVENSAANITKTFTLEEVVIHNKKEDCYLISNNNVYDVTKYIEADMHKAGVQVIIDSCGKDVTASFANAHKGKSKAFSMFEKYNIGKIK